MWEDSRPLIKTDPSDASHLSNAQSPMSGAAQDERRGASSNSNGGLDGGPIGLQHQPQHAHAHRLSSDQRPSSVGFEDGGSGDGRPSEHGLTPAELFAAARSHHQPPPHQHPHLLAVTSSPGNLPDIKPPHLHHPSDLEGGSPASVSSTAAAQLAAAAAAAAAHLAAAASGNSGGGSGTPGAMLGNDGESVIPGGGVPVLSTPTPVKKSRRGGGVRRGDGRRRESYHRIGVVGESGLVEGENGRTYSDLFEDLCLVRCLVCGKELHYHSMNYHLTKIHGTEDRSAFVFVKKTYHRCKLCNHECLFDSSRFGCHVKTAHNVSVGEYTSKYLFGFPVRGGGNSSRPRKKRETKQQKLLQQQQQQQQQEQQQQQQEQQQQSSQPPGNWNAGPHGSGGGGSNAGQHPGQHNNNNNNNNRQQQPSSQQPNNNNNNNNNNNSMGHQQEHNNNGSTGGDPTNAAMAAAFTTYLQHLQQHQRDWNSYGGSIMRSSSVESSASGAGSSSAPSEPGGSSGGIPGGSGNGGVIRRTATGTVQKAAQLYERDIHHHQILAQAQHVAGRPGDRRLDLEDRREGGQMLQQQHGHDLAQRAGQHGLGHHFLANNSQQDQPQSNINHHSRHMSQSETGGHGWSSSGQENAAASGAGLMPLMMIKTEENSEGGHNNGNGQQVNSDSWGRGGAAGDNGGRCESAGDQDRGRRWGDERNSSDRPPQPHHPQHWGGSFEIKSEVDVGGPTAAPSSSTTGGVIVGKNNSSGSQHQPPMVSMPPAFTPYSTAVSGGGPPFLPHTTAGMLAAVSSSGGYPHPRESVLGGYQHSLHHQQTAQGLNFGLTSDPRGSSGTASSFHGSAPHHKAALGGATGALFGEARNELEDPDDYRSGTPEDWAEKDRLKVAQVNRRRTTGSSLIDEEGQHEMSSSSADAYSRSMTGFRDGGHKEDDSSELRDLSLKHIRMSTSSHHPMDDSSPVGGGENRLRHDSQSSVNSADHHAR